MPLVDLAVELRQIASELELIADEATSKPVRDPVTAVANACSAFSDAWSGSWIGYHSRVYYRDFQPPPLGAHFSPTWGFVQMFTDNNVGDWVEYRYRDVIDAIEQSAGNPDLAPVEDYAKRAQNKFDSARSSIVSALSVALSLIKDTLLTEELAKAKAMKLFSQEDIARAQIAGREFRSNDMVAMSEGVAVPPHVARKAHVVELTAAGVRCGELAKLARRVADHIERRDRCAPASAHLRNGKIFIGHGQSPAWRELKEFIQERLGLECDEFNRVSPAGIAHTERLAAMLDSSTLALLVLTAEDERSDGSMHARENVVHEAGLFQGKLGFKRAIVVLEEGCEEFSNIHGLGQIRFTHSRIATCFEDVRKLMEREELITPGSGRA
jgi:hypothetical protein